MKGLGVEVVYPEISETLQKIAFQYGYKWPSRGKIVSMTDVNLLSFNFSAPYCFGHCSEKKWSGYDKMLHGVKDFAEIIQYIKDNSRPETVEVKCGDYIGEISLNGETLSIKCQTMSFKDVKTVYHRMLGQRQKMGLPD